MANLQKLLDEAEMATNLRQVVGALVFSSSVPLGIEAIRKCLRNLPPEKNGEEPPFKKVLPRDIRTALLDIKNELERLNLGVELREVADGYRFQTQAEAGPWVRSLLKKDKPARLSPTTLETLAIIAYRQPIAKSEIEGIRGVTVDHVVRALMEMHLIRMVGRSDLPGRPFLYGTTPLFLEHFGLKSLDELNDIDPTLKREKPASSGKKPKAPAKPEAESAQQELEALTAAAGNAKDDSGRDGGDTIFASAEPSPDVVPDEVKAPVYSVGEDGDEEEPPPQKGSVVFIQGDTDDDTEDSLEDEEEPAGENHADDDDSPDEKDPAGNDDSSEDA